MSGVLLVEAVPGGWFSNGVTSGRAPSKNNCVVHMLPRDQCTRFAISKMTTIKACPTIHTRSRHSLSLLLPPKMPAEATSAFRLAYKRGTTPPTRLPIAVHPVGPALDYGKLRHD
jgi:hypothetical protein